MYSGVIERMCIVKPVPFWGTCAVYKIYIECGYGGVVKSTDSDAAAAGSRFLNV